MEVTQNLLDEIKVTYADNQSDGKPFEETEPIRRLDWEASQPVEGDMIETALKATGEGYNEFEPVAVAKTIIRTDPEAKVFVAREGSVCLYIKTAWNTEMMAAMQHAGADETDLQPNGSARIWWD